MFMEKAAEPITSDDSDSADPIPSLAATALIAAYSVS
jgi:hypothetical protein